MVKRIGFISRVLDSIGNTYLAININMFIVENYLFAFKKYCLDKNIDFDEYITNQKNRDHNKYHMTIISNDEISKIDKDKFLNIGPVEYNLISIGNATDSKGNSAYYIIVESLVIDEFRKNLGLNKKNLHITIGFNKKDVHGKPKDMTTEIYYDID